MSMVRIRAENDDIFDIESTWLPILLQKDALVLPIGSKQTMDDLTHYVRQSDKILRLPRRSRMDEQGRIVRSPINVAALDAQATGVIANRGITAENQMEAFTRAFIKNCDLTSLVEIAEVCNPSNKLTAPTCSRDMWELAGACLDRMLNEGPQAEGVPELLGGVQ